MNAETKGPTVLAVVDDMFFWAKIDAVAKELGVHLVHAPDSRKLAEKLEASSPDLIILDLNNTSCSPLDAIRRIKGDPRLERIPLVAFLSHVQVELEQAARRAGCETIMPRSAFSRKLVEILRMGYGRPDDSS